ncbi:unnamed protein product [Amoebophrya sp. A120]|nr:unnamed protein product [Amoebophrya sp. A120]|eukprot:GSA120T00025229001.1
MRSTWIPGRYYERAPTFVRDRPQTCFIASGRFVLAVNTENGKIIDRYDAGGEVLALQGTKSHVVVSIGGATEELGRAVTGRRGQNALILLKPGTHILRTVTGTGAAQDSCSTKGPALVRYDVAEGESVCKLSYREATGEVLGVLCKENKLKRTTYRVVAFAEDTLQPNVVPSFPEFPSFSSSNPSANASSVLFAATETHLAVVLPARSRTVLVAKTNDEAWAPFVHKRCITALSLDPNSRHLAVGDSRGMVYTCFAPFLTPTLTPTASSSKKLKTPQYHEKKVGQSSAVKTADKQNQKQNTTEKTNTDEHVFSDEGLSDESDCEDEQLLVQQPDTAPLLLPQANLTENAGLHHWHAREVTALGHLGESEIFSGSFESVLVLRNLETDTKKFFPRLGGGPIVHLQVSPDFRKMAVAMSDNTLAFVDLHEANKVARLRGLLTPHEVDEQAADVCENNRIQLQNLPNGDLAIHSGRGCVQFFGHDSNALKNNASVDTAAGRMRLAGRYSKRTQEDAAAEQKLCGLEAIHPYHSLAVQARNGATAVQSLLEEAQNKEDSGRGMYYWKKFGAQGANANSALNHLEQPWRVTHFAHFEAASFDVNLSGDATTTAGSKGGEQKDSTQNKNQVLHHSRTSTAAKTLTLWLVTVEQRPAGAVSKEQLDVVPGALLKFWKQEKGSWVLDTSVYDAHWKPVTGLLAYSGDYNCAALSYPTAGAASHGNNIQEQAGLPQEASRKKNKTASASFASNSFVITTSEDGTVKKWQYERTTVNGNSNTRVWQATQVGKWKEEEKIDCAALTVQDGSSLAFSSEESIVLWSADTFTQLGEVMTQKGPALLRSNNKAPAGREDAGASKMPNAKEEGGQWKIKNSTSPPPNYKILQLEFAVLNSELFALLALGFRKLNVWDLRAQRIVHQIPDVFSDHFAWNPNTLQLALPNVFGGQGAESAEVKIYVPAPSATGSNGVEVLELSESVGTQDKEEVVQVWFEKAEDRLLVWNLNKQQLVAVETNFSSSSSTANKLFAVNDGVHSVLEQQEGGIRDDAEASQPVKGMHFSRLFAQSTSGQASSGDASATLPKDEVRRQQMLREAVGAVASSWSNGGGAAPYLATNKHLIERVVDPHTASHVLPKPQHLLQRFLHLTLYSNAKSHNSGPLSGKIRMEAAEDIATERPYAAAPAIAMGGLLPEETMGSASREINSLPCETADFFAKLKI